MDADHPAKGSLLHADPHWLYLSKSESELLQPLPPGSLNVKTVRAGKT